MVKRDLKISKKNAILKILSSVAENPVALATKPF